MIDIPRLLDDAKTQLGIDSDRQLAARIKVSNVAVVHWRQRKFLPKPEHAQQLAEMAGRDPAEVVAAVLIEGAKSPALVKTLQRFLTIAVAGIVCILCKMFPAQCRLTPHHKPFIFQPLPN